MTGAATPAGARRPYQFTISYSGNPPSAIVGMAGNWLERFLAVTPSAFNRPARMCGNKGEIVSMVITICPLTTSSAGPALPLYDTCVSLMPPDDCRNSPASCAGVPEPADPIVSSPGLA